MLVMTGVGTAESFAHCSLQRQRSKTWRAAEDLWVHVPPQLIHSITHWQNDCFSCRWCGSCGGIWPHATHVQCNGWAWGVCGGSPPPWSTYHFAGQQWPDCIALGCTDCELIVSVSCGYGHCIDCVVHSCREATSVWRCCLHRALRSGSRMVMAGEDYSLQTCSVCCNYTSV